MTWVKICGMTNLEDTLVAIDAGADAVGFVFYEKSPRCVAVAKAREICSQLPENVERIGVFVNEQEDSICSVVDAAGITGVQMHGDHEDPHVADLVVARRPEIKVLAAVSMNRPNPQGWAMMWHPESVRAFLVDSGNSSKHGGTGNSFDWNAAVPVLNDIKKLGKVVAAGGLTPANVEKAADVLKPWGVDVVSGVEASPGKKDPEKVRAFVRVVREMDRRVG
ncbi:MAG TPA: phosphoribosylanthranilate isomerase [Candidatus Binatia bacterium]|nr:phosphoribosylanthranilate isomerase [Candidatus Binatia bacterium]